MSRVKVSDLEVTERGLPLLIYVDQPKPAWGEEEKLPLLHICTCDGVKRYKSGATSRTYNITNCNRPIEWSNLYYGKELDTSNYRLCPRCAPKGKTLETFEAKLAEYHRVHAENDVRYAQEKKREEAQRRIKRNALAERLDIITRRYVQSGVVVEKVGDPVYALRILAGNYTYEIREVNE